MLRRREPWQFSLEFMLGESLDGKVLGIVGAGRIGRETARLAEAFGATAIYAGRADRWPSCSAADVVSLHTPLTAETRHLIDGAALARCGRPRCSSTRRAVRSSTRPRSSTRSARGAIAGAALDVSSSSPP